MTRRTGQISTPRFGTSYRSACVLVAFICCIATSEFAQAGTIRLWPEAVVVDDTICLSDLCELTGFDADQEETLASLAVADAPPSGGSVIVHIQMVRRAMSFSGVNMASVTTRGSVECRVSRPAELNGIPAQGAESVECGPAVPSSRVAIDPLKQKKDEVVQIDAGQTLRQAVVDFFDRQFDRYNGQAKVSFDRTSEQVLNLSGPEFEFSVRMHSRSPVGLVHLEVAVSKDGAIVQKVPMVVGVVMMRDVVIAARPISKDTVIRDADVRVMSMAFDRTDRIGVGSTIQVVGQRSRRFMSAGAMIGQQDLEPVPLVEKGQLVTLETVVGMIAVVTTGKAMESGFIGDTIAVRDPGSRRKVLEGVVTGPGKVRLGGAAGASTVHLAGGVR